MSSVYKVRAVSRTLRSNDNGCALLVQMRHEGFFFFNLSAWFGGTKRSRVILANTATLDR